jgi:ATP-dependent RNA helicase DDX52/ROK1
MQLRKEWSWCRIGRTGRAGRSGAAITFFEEKDAGQLKRVANLMRASGMEVPEWMLRLSKQPTVLKQRQRDQRKRGQPANMQKSGKRRRRSDA